MVHILFPDAATQYQCDVKVCIYFLSLKWVNVMSMSVRLSYK